MIQVSKILIKGTVMQTEKAPINKSLTAPENFSIQLFIVLQ